MSSEQIQIDIPNPPDHTHALDTVPADIQERWKTVYEASFRLARRQGGASAHADALKQANRLIRVPEPQNHAEALALPDWQVMKREELSFINLPSHARRELGKQGKATASTYVRVYTTDGKEHFFPIPKT